MYYRYVFPPYKIYINLMTLPHGTTFLEHVNIKYVTRFFYRIFIYITYILTLISSSVHVSFIFHLQFELF